MALKAILRTRFSGALIPQLLRASFSAAAPVAGDDSMATQMVEFASTLRKKGDGGYREAMQVLEHGVSFMKDPAALSKIQVTIANFHADQGNMQESIDVLQSVANNKAAPLEVRVCSIEALAGLHLQMHQDDLAASCVKDLSKLAGKSSEAVEARVKGLSGLLKLAKGDYDAAASCFEGFPSDAAPGSSTLARAEVTHVRGDSLEAKHLYELAKKESSQSRVPATVTTSPEEVQAAALAGLGQLATDLGDYDEAETKLSEALQVVESISGETHSRVGLVLSCMADLYTRRAKAQNSGYMIAEGLYRRSLNLLKAPELDKDFKETIQYLDTIALTRARYASILSLVEQRAKEGEKLSAWANSAWKNQRRLSEILEASTTRTSKDALHSVVDVRLGRVF